FAKVCYHPVTPGDFSIDKISQTCDEKDDQCRGACVLPGGIKRNDKKHGQAKPTQSNPISPVHLSVVGATAVAGGDDPGTSFWILNRARFQIGTFFFNSSTIHRLA